MSGKIRIEHSQPATGNPTQDMQQSDEYLLVTKRGNEVMVAYSHEQPEDATPLLMEAANLLGRFNQISMMAQTAQQFGKGVGMAGSGLNQQAQPIMREHRQTPEGMGQKAGHIGPRPDIVRSAPEGDPHEGIGHLDEDVPPTDVERELDEY